MAAAAACLVPIAASAGQTQLVALPTELDRKAGNTHHIIEGPTTLGVAIENVPSGRYLALSLRRALGLHDAGAARIGLRLEVTPGLAFDTRFVDSQAFWAHASSVTVFDGAIDFPGVTALPAPEVALLAPYGAAAYAIPFDEPVTLYGDCWWGFQFVTTSRSIKVDAHDHRTIDFPGREPVAGPAMQSTGTNSPGLIFSAPPRFAADYGAGELAFRASLQLQRPFGGNDPLLSVLVLGTPLAMPIRVGSLALHIDPLAGAVVPLLATPQPSTQAVDIRTPYRPWFDRAMVWAQVLSTDGQSLLATATWASTPPPWTPNGLGVTSSIVDTANDPGHQAFPVLMLWRGAP